MINRFLIPVLAFGLLVVVLAFGIVHSPDKGLIASPLIGKPAPQFSLPTLGNPAQLVRSADLKGRWYLFNVWGSWCGTCRAEHEMLLTVRRSGAVPLVGLDWNDDDAQALGYLQQFGNPYQEVAVDHTGQVAIDWGVYGAPETYLVNPQGIIVYKHVGELTYDTWTQKILPLVPASERSKS